MKKERPIAPGMRYCGLCAELMIRASSYDPEGTHSLHIGAVERDRKGKIINTWVCLNGGCPDGKYNRG